MKLKKRPSTDSYYGALNGIVELYFDSGSGSIKESCRAYFSYARDYYNCVFRLRVRNKKSNLDILKHIQDLIISSYYD